MDGFHLVQSILQLVLPTRSCLRQQSIVCTTTISSFSSMSVTGRWMQYGTCKQWADHSQIRQHWHKQLLYMQLSSRLYSPQQLNPWCGAQSISYRYIIISTPIQSSQRSHGYAVTAERWKTAYQVMKQVSETINTNTHTPPTHTPATPPPPTIWMHVACAHIQV